MLTKLSLDSLLDREFVGHHRAERVQITEVLVISSGEHSDGHARDPLDAALRDLTVGKRSNFKKFPTHTQDHGDA